MLYTSVMIGNDCIGSCAKTQRYKYLYRHKELKYRGTTNLESC